MKLNTRVKKVGIVAGVVLVAVVILGRQFNIPVISTGINYILYPLEKTIFMVSSNFNNVMSHFQDVNELLAEKASLEDEVSRLRYENSILSQYQEENKNLKTLLDMNNRYEDYEGVGANIIDKDPGNWYKVFSLDKGTSRGVTKDKVILANGGLVGHVESATDIKSSAMSIIDSRSAVSAKVVRTGDVGLVKGNQELSSKGLCMLVINAAAEVVKGDQIITSHLSSIYPPGILIGVVEEVVAGNNELENYAYIQPVVDFKHLEQVLVINNE